MIDFAQTLTDMARSELRRVAASPVLLICLLIAVFGLLAVLPTGEAPRGGPEQAYAAVVGDSSDLLVTVSFAASERFSDTLPSADGYKVEDTDKVFGLIVAPGGLIFRVDSGTIGHKPALDTPGSPVRLFHELLRRPPPGNLGR